MRRRDVCLGLVAMPALMRSAFADEVSSITLISQHGLPYLPLMVMEAQKLVEKHAAKLGVPNLATDYRTLGGTQSIIDALIGGSMHFGIAGVPGLATLWDKTVGTANEVRGLCAAQAMPFLLVTNKPEIKTIRDFKEGDTIAIISRSTEVTGHYGVSPFQDYEIAAPGVHLVLKSYETLGGPTTNGVMFMAKKFRDANPKVTHAVYAALSEASDFINREPPQA